MDAEDEDDQRVVELGSLAAIYPEMVVDADDPFTVTLEVPVNPPMAVTVSATNPQEVSYLPSLQLRVTLPPGYPETQPPNVAVSTLPAWLPADVLRRLEEDSRRLWDELGRDLVVFAFVDHVQQAADDVFGLADSHGFLDVGLQHQVFILDYDMKAKQAAFNKETFHCGICLDPQKGVKCHRLQDCGHVFCVQCLQDFYNSAIKSGDLAAVRCPEPNCAKEREAALPEDSRGRPQLVSVSPGELLQIPLDEAVVRRYVDLRYKTQLESDKDTVYCPRTWCNGAARSKKHRRPKSLTDETAADRTQEAEEADKADKADSSSQRLAICEDCGFAFCSRCYQSWHGDFVACVARHKSTEELTEEEQASLRYLARHSTPCPTCAAPVQKSHGCNHMICFRCNTHFCYLCSAWLEPRNPYRHFNKDASGRTTACYNRLWDLETGDDSDEDDGREPEWRLEDVVDVVGLEEHHRQQHQQNHQAQQNHHARRDRRNGPPLVQEAARQVNVAREGPLVLRIALDDAPQPPAADPGPRQAPGPGPGPGPAPNVHVHDVNRRPRDGRGGGGGGGGGHFVGGGRGEGGRGRAGRARRGNLHRGRAGGPPGRIDGHRGAGGPPAAAVDGEEPLGDDMEAWVRHFVQLALEDNEHLMDL